MARVVPALVVMMVPLLGGCGGATGASTGASPVLAKAASPGAAPSAPLPPNAIRRSSVRRALAEGPAAFLQRIDLEDHPVLVGGKFYGFRVAALRGDPAFWAGVDVRPGDVLRRVNGRSIERPQEAFDAFHSLETAPELRVDMERAGVAMVLTFRIVDDEARPATPR